MEGQFLLRTWIIEKYTTPYGTGFYTNIARGPLYDEENITGFSPPDPLKPSLYKNLEKLIMTEKSEYYIIGRVHTTIFETAWALRGMDNLLIDMAIEPERAEAVLQFPFRHHLEVIKKIAEMGADMIWLGDDVGAQESMLISPEMWRRFLKPKMADIIESAKSTNKNITIAYHSDGYNVPILPDLIDIGVEVLNPVQIQSMDPRMLKKEYGNRMAFFGGIDVQTTLPFKDPESIQSDFRELFNVLGKGGGWMCAPTHHVQLDTPVENFFALMDCLEKCKYF
jgi:uroporphyrinogen decarboxylase